MLDPRRDATPQAGFSRQIPDCFRRPKKPECRIRVFENSVCSVEQSFGKGGEPMYKTFFVKCGARRRSGESVASAIPRSIASRPDLLSGRAPSDFRRPVRGSFASFEGRREDPFATAGFAFFVPVATAGGRRLFDRFCLRAGSSSKRPTHGSDDRNDGPRRRFPSTDPHGISFFSAPVAKRGFALPGGQ